MAKNIMFRFDDITREERYFSATILPYLFSYNGFEGLIFFEKFLKSKGLIKIFSNIDTVQILTEVYLERDLSYYKINIPAVSFEKKMKVQSKPDLLIITEESLYLFECKVFMNESEYKLYEQIKKQKYIFDIVENVSEQTFINEYHFLILPYEYEISDCIVITWDSLYKVFSKVVPIEDYFLSRLKMAIKRFH